MRYLIATAALTLAACGSSANSAVETDKPKTVAKATQAADSGQRETAVFAGGCFWCTEKDFEEVRGVIEAESGYTGGTTENPTYREVTYNETGHYEAVRVTYDPAQVSYEELVDYYWTTVDPTDPSGQFCDKGSSYRTAVFVTPEQRAVAEESLADIREIKPFSETIVTPILEAQTFYPAEDYHQDYYKKNPIRYNIYRTGCGRDARLNTLWGQLEG